MRILDNLIIDEISAVDFPAQEGARMTVMKHNLRREEEDAMFDLDKFDKRIAEVRKNNPGIGYVAALEKARHDFPVDFARYVAAPVVAKPDPNAALIQKQKRAVADFMKLVDAHQVETGCTRTEAMEAVRKGDPDAFRKFQEV